MTKFAMGLIFIGLFVLTGCTEKSEGTLEEAQKFILQGEKTKALEQLLGVLRNETDQEKTLEASRVGSQLAHFQMKRYDAAMEFYLHLANYSSSLEEKVSSLKYLSQILVDHARDYERALEVIEKILTMNLSKEERFHYRLQLAKANYQLARVDQAQVELNVLKEQKDLGPLSYDISLFESNILASQKKNEEAAKILKQLISEFPARAKVDGLQLNLVSTYEDMNDLEAAIEAMEEMKAGYSDPQFLELRISRLKERRKNQPGAKGLKK